jgi:hypothetical protein
MPHVKDLVVDYVSLVDRGAVRSVADKSQAQRFLLWKRDSAVIPFDPKGSPMPDTIDKAALDPAVREALEKAETERDDALAKAQAAEEKQAELEKQAGGGKAKPAPKMDDETDEDDDLKKADLSPEVRAILEKRDAEVAELRKDADANRARAESAEEIAKSEREARVEAEFVDLAKSDLPHMGDPEVVGKRLKKFSETLEKADYDEYFREQSAINEQLRKGSIEAEYGRSGGRPAAPSAPGLPDAMQKAEELQKSDPNMSSAEAFRRAMRDPAVAAQYEKERAGV